MSPETLGRLLIAVGIGIALIGGLFWLVARLPFFSDLGNLPGDIRIQGQGFSCIIPLGSMLLISVLLTIALNILIRLINR